MVRVALASRLDDARPQHHRLKWLLSTCRSQSRGEHGSQQCERWVSRPCLLIVRLVHRCVATDAVLMRMLSHDRECRNLPAR